MSKLLILISLIATLILVGCDISAAKRPTPTPTATPRAAVTPTSIAPEDSGEDGHQLFINKGCASCHGQEAQGTNIAPGLPGHTAEMIRRQVRSPIGVMPRFTTEVLSDEELEKIIAFIDGLEGEHAHVPPADVTQEVALHHWMALLALKVDDIPEATHHVGHIIDLVTGDHLHEMEEVLTMLQEGHLHDAEHAIEGMLAGTAVTDLTLGVVHLELALGSLRSDDVDDAIHHIRHFLESASDHEKEATEEILGLLQANDPHEAEHKLESLMEGGAEEHEHGE